MDQTELISPTNQSYSISHRPARTCLGHCALSSDLAAMVQPGSAILDSLSYSIRVTDRQMRTIGFSEQILGADFRSVWHWTSLST